MREKRGVSLVEILLATFVTVIVAGAVFSIYPRLFQGVDVSTQKMVAFEAARQAIETLKNADFGTVLYNVSYDPANAEVPIANQFNTGMPNSSRVFYVERMHEAGGALITNSDVSKPCIVNAEVVVCFLVGRRMVGEDTNFNGALDAGEDQDGDLKISSPVRLRTLIMRP